MPQIASFPQSISSDISAYATPIGLGLTEAEALTIGSGFVKKANPHASASAFLQADAGVSSAGGVFDGPAGVYDLAIGYFDENDGEASMELRVNGVPVASFLWDAWTIESTVNDATRAEYVVAAMALAPGDVIELFGMADGGEPLRTDYISVAASTGHAIGDSFRVEMEDIAPYFLNSYEVVKNGAASGGYVIQDEYGVWVDYEFEQGGSFDITIGYFDETDGVSDLWVELNGERLTYLLWDDTTGSAIANAASARTFTLRDVAVEVGDSLSLHGTSDGGEPMRLDYLDFTRVAPGSGPVRPPLPDLWYFEGDALHVSLNTGVYSFDERNTGIIVTQYGGADAEDFDGDGDLDFITVEVGNPFPLPQGDWEDIPGTLSLTTTFYQNDGTGSFSPAGQSTQAFDITWSAYGLFETQSLHDVFSFTDAGDMDGDGDIDFFGFSITAQAMLVFENDGTNSFTLLEPQMPSAYGDLAYNGNDGFFTDMNGDAYLDILYSGSNEVNATYVLINDGTGVFTAVDSISDSDDGNAFEVVEDLDGDGDNDFALIGVSDGGTISAYINDGTGAREAGVYPYYPPSSDTWKGALQIGDFDGDGINEIITGGLMDEDQGIDPGLRTFGVDLENDTLVLESYDPDYSGHMIAAEDFDGDGDLDLLFADRATSPSQQEESVVPRLLLNDGTGSFSDAPWGFTTGVFRGSNLFYSPPAVNVGYFDEAYPVA